jgi:hypothetical protein
MYARSGVRSILKFWCNEKFLGLKLQSAGMLADWLKGPVHSGLQGYVFAFEGQAQ